MLFAGLGGLLFGYDSSDIAIALPVRARAARARPPLTLPPPLQFIERSFPTVAVSNALKEAIVSVTTLGASFGAFTGGSFSDAFGRRSAIILCDVIFLCAALKMGVAQTPDDLIKGRALMGVAIGLASIVGPVYIAESSPNSIRATLVVMYSIEIGVGTSLAYLLDFGFTHAALSWRLMLSFAALPALVQCISMFFLPESPRWLAQFGRLDEAKEVAATLSIDPQDTDRDAEELEKVHARALFMKTEEGQLEQRDVNWRVLATQLALGVGLFLVNNFSGECALVYYSIEIIGMAGVVSEAAIAQAIVNIGMCATAGVLLGFFFIDRLGRRRLLAISAAGTVASLFLLSLSFALAHRRSPAVASPLSMSGGGGDSLAESCSAAALDCAACLQSSCTFCGPAYIGPGAAPPGICLARDSSSEVAAAKEACTQLGQSTYWGGNSSSDGGGSGPQYNLYREGCPSGYGWLSLLALCSFQFWFQLGIGIIPSAVNAEYYPNSVRGICNGSAVALSWLGNFCVSSTFLSLTASLGAPRTFAINATLVAFGSVLLQFYLPETCGLSFVEIQQLFNNYHAPGAPPPWALHEAILAQREKDDAETPTDRTAGLERVVGVLQRSFSSATLVESKEL